MYIYSCVMLYPYVYVCTSIYIYIRMYCRFLCLCMETSSLVFLWVVSCVSDADVEERLSRSKVVFVLQQMCCICLQKVPNIVHSICHGYVRISQKHEQLSKCKCFVIYPVLWDMVQTLTHIRYTKRHMLDKFNLYRTRYIN